MDQNTVMALAVAAVVTPWVTEVIKAFLPGEYTGKKALTITMIVSIAVAVGVLWYQGKLVWQEPSQIIASAGMVIGIATAVYQYMKKAIQDPVAKMKSMM